MNTEIEGLRVMELEGGYIIREMHEPTPSGDAFELIDPNGQFLGTGSATSLEDYAIQHSMFN